MANLLQQDGPYLQTLSAALGDFERKFGKFDCVLYQAGVDPLESDRLGRCVFIVSIEKFFFFSKAFLFFKNVFDYGRAKSSR